MTLQGNKVVFTIPAATLHCSLFDLKLNVKYPACLPHQTTKRDKLHPPFALLFLSLLLSLLLLGFARLVQESDQDHSSPNASLFVVDSSSGLRHFGGLCRCQEGFGGQTIQGQASSRVPGLQDRLGFAGFQCELGLSQYWFWKLSGLETAGNFQPSKYLFEFWPWILSSVVV